MRHQKAAASRIAAKSLTWRQEWFLRVMSFLKPYMMKQRLHHSIVLMALVDADNKFIYTDVSWNGRISYGGIFAGCILSETLDGRLADEDMIQIANKI